MKAATKIFRVGLNFFGLSIPFNLIFFLSMFQSYQQTATNASVGPTQIASRLEALLTYANIGTPLLLANAVCLIAGWITTWATSRKRTHLQPQS